MDTMQVVLHKPSNQYSSFSVTRVKGENVIFASIWLLLTNSLECGQNTYSADIKVICSHKESQPIENGVNTKLG